MINNPLINEIEVEEKENEVISEKKRKDLAKPLLMELAGEMGRSSHIKRINALQNTIIYWFWLIVVFLVVLVYYDAKTRGILLDTITKLETQTEFRPTSPIQDYFNSNSIDNATITNRTE